MPKHLQMRMSDATRERLQAINAKGISFAQMVMETPNEVYSKKPYVAHKLVTDEAMKRLDQLAKTTGLSKALLVERAIDYHFDRLVNLNLNSHGETKGRTRK